MNKQRGFTIIELIVVIAIIAVLAGIVLVNVTNYINKGKDAAAKGNLTSALTNGAVYFDTNGNYTNFLTSTGFTSVTTALTNAGYATTSSIVSGGTGWCASVVLKATTTNSFCVDSTGKKVEAVTASATCASGVCP
ncbi:MAG: prepilin-type N-terminal cleavage/methylation domain-containing protein [Candidatus Staskawiczbacteria bacterium]